MNDQTRTFLTFSVHVLLASIGLMLLVAAFMISAELATDHNLAVSLLKLFSMVMLSYGATRAWLIFKREVSKK